MASNSTKTTLLCAYTLAKAKRYAQAEELILSESEVAKTIEAMDLLARMRAEQGDLVEARRLWQEIQELHPEHKPSRVALRNLNKKAHTSTPLSRLCTCAIVTLVGLILGFILASAITVAPPERYVTLNWPEIPSAAHLDQLDAWRGKVSEVKLSSSFFGDASRINNRRVLVDFITERLDLTEDAIYIATSATSTLDVKLRLMD